MKVGKIIGNMGNYSFFFLQSRRGIHFSTPVSKMAQATSMKKMETKQRKLMAKMEAKAIEREAYRKPHSHTMAALANGTKCSIVKLCTYVAAVPYPHAQLTASLPFPTQQQQTWNWWGYNVAWTSQISGPTNSKFAAVEWEMEARPITARADKGKLDSTPWGASYLREHEPRRVRMVETLLLDRITELLADERFLEFLKDTSVEITGVQMNRFNGQLNVMWAPTGDAERDQQIHRILQSMTPDLRELLCSQHILGFVPRIEFVRDRTVKCLKHLQDRLANIDTGPPDRIGSTVEREVLEVTVEGNPESGLRSSLSGAMVDPLGLDRMPELRTDIGGIDRAKFLEELQSSQKRPFRKTKTEGQVDVVC